MNAPSPSWYDVLDLDPDASQDEIRAAWKAGIADLGPTDRRFRLMNQAAEVLLDPAQRAAYDQALRSERSEREEPAVVEEVAQQPSRDQVTQAPTRPESESESEPKPEPESEPAEAERRVIPAWLLAGLGLLAAVLVGLCVWQAGEPTDADVEDATREALLAAGPAAEALLSYDYRDLEATRAAAEDVITDGYRDETYKPFFEEVVSNNAVETKSIVKTETVEAAVVRSGVDRVQVFVLIDRPTTNAASTEPVVYRDSATLTLERQGGEWLVDAVEIGQ